MKLKTGYLGLKMQEYSLLLKNEQQKRIMNLLSNYYKKTENVE